MVAMVISPALLIGYAAYKADLSLSQIGRIERGTINISTLKHICKTLKVDLSYSLKGCRHGL